MNKGIRTYLLVAFGFSWALWLPLLLNARLGLSLPTVPGQYFIASFGPLVGGLIATWVHDGFGGLMGWFRRTFRLGAGFKAWAHGAGLPVLYILVAVLAQRFVVGTWPDWGTFGETAKLPGISWLGTLLIWMVTFGLGEESGWRGYLLPELEKERPLLTSALWVAGIWMIWHLPVFFFNPNYQAMGLGIIGWSVSLTFGSILLAWLAKEGGYSILPLMVWHGGFNLLTASDQAGEVMAMAASFLVIFHGVRLARQMQVLKKGRTNQ